MRSLVCADIHGNYLGLKQILERSNFDYVNDELLCLGDVVDGYPDSKQCIEELLKIHNLIFVLGNHDKWLLDWAIDNDRNMLWISQGGWNTLKSYNFEKPPQEHLDLLLNANYWMADEEKGMVFVHGGLEPQTKIDNQPEEFIMWDRMLLHMAWHSRKKKGFTLTPYKEVFVGHTATTFYGTDKPIHACNIWCIDTGGGWHGRLTIMDIDTKEYWQSDRSEDLYPGSDCHGSNFNQYNSKVIEWMHGSDR